MRVNHLEIKKCTKNYPRSRSLTELCLLIIRRVMELETKKKTKVVCAVATCPSPKDSDTTYHRFPKGNELRKQWLIACKRADKVNPNTSTVCSHHFNADSYERDLKNELLGLPLRKKLKLGAIPSENLLSSEKENLFEKNVRQMDRNKRIEKRGRKQLAQILIESSFSNENNQDQDQDNDQVNVINFAYFQLLTQRLM